MTGSRSLPARPSLESLRKQAKKLARDRSASLRNAQLALAREYGYAGWQDLIAEVSKRGAAAGMARPEGVCASAITTGEYTSHARRGGRAPSSG